MIKVYYSKEIPEALLYCKDDHYNWSDILNQTWYLSNEELYPSVYTLLLVIDD